MRFDPASSRLTATGRGCLWCLLVQNTRGRRNRGPRARSRLVVVQSHSHLIMADRASRLTLRSASTTPRSARSRRRTPAGVQRAKESCRSFSGCHDPHPRRPSISTLSQRSHRGPCYPLFCCPLPSSSVREGTRSWAIQRFFSQSPASVVSVWA